MKIKRFVAPNMRQALRDVRKEQGPDAVILSNRRVDDGIEVVAAVDYDESLIQHSIPMPRSEHGDAALPAAAEALPDAPPAPAASETSAKEPAPSPLPEDAVARSHEDVWARDSEMQEMRKEMHGMRHLLEDQLSSLAWNDQTRRDPTTVCLLRHFAALGLDADIARTVTARSAESHNPKGYIAAAGDALAASLPLVDDGLLDTGGVVAVVGPTGVGKTTSIAKIAARFALRHGRENVALVSSDSFRIGAQEQLATFAQILDVPVHMVTQEGDLSRVLSNLAHKKLVLIDTAGVSQRDRGLAEHLSALRSGAVNVRIFLALAANAQSRTLDEVVREFGRVELNGCIVTKVDEAGSLGGVLAAIIRHNLPLAYIANGQRVPEDIHTAASKRAWIVHYATRLSRDSSVSIGEDYMARNFGEVATHAFA